MSCLLTLCLVVIYMRVKLKIESTILANIPAQVIVGVNIAKYSNFSLLAQHLYDLKYTTTPQVYFTHCNYYIPFDTPAKQVLHKDDELVSIHN